MGNNVQSWSAQIGNVVPKDNTLGRRIEARSRLVEDENLRLPQQRSGERESLAFASGELTGSRSYPLKQAFREAFDKIRKTGASNCLLRLLVRYRWPGESKIESQRAVGQNRVSRQVTHRFAKVVEQ